MATKRKSAFSVYAETKAEEPQQSIHLESNSKSNKQKFNPNNNKNKKFHSNQNNRVVPTKKENNGNGFSKPLNGGVLKRKVELTNNKKEKNKFAKLPVETINESIKMFANPKHTNGNSISKKNMAFIPNLAVKQPIVLTEKQFKQLLKQEKNTEIKPAKIQKKIKPIEVILFIINIILC